MFDKAELERGLVNLVRFSLDTLSDPLFLCCYSSFARCASTRSYDCLGSLPASFRSSVGIADGFDYCTGCTSVFSSAGFSLTFVSVPFSLLVKNLLNESLMELNVFVGALGSLIGVTCSVSASLESFTSKISSLNEFSFSGYFTSSLA